MKKKSTIVLFGIMAIMQIAPLQTSAGQQLKKDNFAALCKINGSQKESFQLGSSIDPKEAYCKGYDLGTQLKIAKASKNNAEENRLLNLIAETMFQYLSYDSETAQRDDVFGGNRRVYNRICYEAFLEGIIHGAVEYEMGYSLAWKLINPPNGGSDDGKGPLWNIVQGKKLGQIQ